MEKKSQETERKLIGVEKQLQQTDRRLRELMRMEAKVEELAQTVPEIKNVLRLDSAPMSEPTSQSGYECTTELEQQCRRQRDR